MGEKPGVAQRDGERGEGVQGVRGIHLRSRPVEKVQKAFGIEHLTSTLLDEEGGHGGGGEAARDVGVDHDGLPVCGAGEEGGDLA